ncbi:MAG: J domain-containing protein [Ramlibacter sp.]|nr:J domain-containing protein [Ramlibacter sp.]MBX3657804.1 J domain-containing protein [Ramlibacter sp.]MCW5648899.1 J domain-containing protein [Ramlibacter sp.]
MQASVPSYYDILQVARDAPADDVRAAYRRLAQRYHPDKSPDNSHAPRVMANLNKAYEVLSDPAQREEHDQWIARHAARKSARTGLKTRMSRPAPLPDLQQRATRWPWYLLFATISCAVAAVGTVAFKSALPVPQGATLVSQDTQSSSTGLVLKRTLSLQASSR